MGIATGNKDDTDPKVICPSFSLSLERPILYDTIGVSIKPALASTSTGMGFFWLESPLNIETLDKFNQWRKWDQRHTDRPRPMSPSNPAALKSCVSMFATPKESPGRSRPAMETSSLMTVPETLPVT